METEKVPAKVDARKIGRCGTGARRSGDHDVKSEGELAEAAHETLEADPDIVALILFGSRARGDARPDSDWDVGVVSHREHLPRLGTNVDAMWIGTREIRNGYETGSIAAVILKYGRVLAARTEEWSAIEGRERPATAQGMQNELENMVGKLAYACESMCAGKDPTQIKWRALRNRMSRGTEASADAAEVLAKHVAAGLGITLRKKHNVGGRAGPVALSTSSVANAGCACRATSTGCVDDATASLPWRATLRHVDNCQRDIAWRRATSPTRFPARKLSRTTRAFSSALQRRRDRRAAETPEPSTPARSQSPAESRAESCIG